MSRSQSLFTVFLVIFVDLIGFGIILPILPFFAKNYNASPLHIGLLYSIYSLCQLIFSPIWGALSDRVGRRPIMMLSTLGSSISYLMFAFSESFWAIFVSRMFAGIMGGNIATAQAYVTDITSEKDRAKGMGMIGAAFGLGFSLGPALTVLLIHPKVLECFSLGNFQRYCIPGFFASALSFLSFILVFLKLPETVNFRMTDQHQTQKKRSVFSKAFWLPFFTDQNIYLRLLLIGIFLTSFGQANLYSSFPLFCQDELSLSAENVGMEYLWMGIISIVIQGMMIHRLTRKFGEAALFLTGSILMTLGMMLIPFSGSAFSLTLYLGVLSVGGSLMLPTLTSLISKQARPQRAGEMMGTSQGLSSLGRVLGPSWGGLLFSLGHTVPFISTGIVLSTSIIIGYTLQNHSLAKNT